MTPAIRIESIGKRYHIGERARYLSLREQLTNLLRYPGRLLGGSNGNGRRRREEIWALRDVSLEIQEGEVVGLIGRNGAGKSTLLKILSRITRPTTGWADVRGRMGSLLEVGTGFHPQLTGRENVFLNGAILGMRRSEILRKFDEIVAFSEIEKFIDTPVKHYSSGMGVRLAFAVAARLETEILLIDEVLAVGDIAFQKKCLGKMGQVTREGRTILFVSHNCAALRSLCSRAVHIDGGRVREIGEAGEVISHYLQANVEANLERAWLDPRSAPGDDRARLRSVRALRSDRSEEPITVHTPLQIEFTYSNYVPGAVLNVSMVLYNAEQGCVLTTVSSFVPRPAGLIRDVVDIPGDFLNTGSYSVDVLIVKDASRPLLRENNVVAFEVHEGNVVGNWYGRAPGVVRPKLNWVSDVVEEGESCAFQ